MHSLNDSIKDNLVNLAALISCSVLLAAQSLLSRLEMRQQNNIAEALIASRGFLIVLDGLKFASMAQVLLMFNTSCVETFVGFIAFCS